MLTPVWEVEPGTKHNGLLVDPVDLDGVRAALARLLDDPALRRELGERARAGVLKRFTMRRLAGDYLKVIAGAP
ncbi:glycosyltransferase [Microbispora sp. NPDC046933]|uniref:glycosyltransferase n=1 Tax=Microbispora sp. NPDC046933 TaxID=3155618 RepID=UPI0033C2E5A4